MNKLYLNRGLIIFPLILLLNGCGITKMYEGAIRPANQLSRIFKTSLELQHPGIVRVSRINHEALLRRGAGAYDVLPGWYDIEVEYYNPDCVGPGCLAPGGTQKFYTIRFEAKAGYTYTPAIKGTGDPPKELCITEEVHNAAGHKVSRFSDFRFPSKNAKHVACS